MSISFIEYVFYAQMALQESLAKFKKQQEKCQTTLTSIAAKAGSSKPTVPQKFTPAVPTKPTPAVKFSNDTERLQHINSIRKAPVGAQIKRVIDLLLEVKIQLSFPFIHLVLSDYLVKKNNKRSKPSKPLNAARIHFPDKASLYTRTN